MPVAFILRKHHAGKYLESFRLRPVKTQYFQNRIRDKIEDLKAKIEGGDVKIKNFHIDDIAQANMYILDVCQYAYIANTIVQVQQHTAASEIDTLKSMKRAKISALMFELSEETIIAFDTVQIFSKAFQKGYLATYDESGLDDLPKDSFLLFNLNLPCIYFRNKKKLLVFDLDKTERIFNLLEHYQNKANEKFQKLSEEDIIDLDPIIFSREIKHTQTARKIYKLILEDRFDVTVEECVKYKKEIDNQNIDDESCKIDIENNKILIHSKENLDSFLHFIGYDVQESLRDRNQKYLSITKRRLQTKSDTTSVR